MLSTCPISSIHKLKALLRLLSLSLCEMKGWKRRGWGGGLFLSEEGKPQWVDCASQVFVFFLVLLSGCARTTFVLLFFSEMLSAFIGLFSQHSKESRGEWEKQGEGELHREIKHKGVGEARDRGKWEHKSSEWDTWVSRQNYALNLTISSLLQSLVGQLLLHLSSLGGGGGNHPCLDSLQQLQARLSQREGLRMILDSYHMGFSFVDVFIIPVIIAICL